MKKIILAVLGAVMAAAITACGTGAGKPAQSSVTQAEREEIVAVWKAANEKTAALTSVALSTSMDSSVRSGEESIQASMYTEIFLNEAGQEDMTCLWNTDASLDNAFSTSLSVLPSISGMSRPRSTAGRASNLP